MFARADKPQRSPAARLVNPRRAERFEAVNIGCELGLIKDLSETGVRVEFCGRPKAEIGSVVKLTVRSSLQAIAVSGQVVWIRRRWLRSGEMGIRFVSATPAIARALVELVQHGFVDTTNLAAFSAGNAGPASGSGAGRAGVHASVEIEDYYGALGVERTATYEQIHAAFRALARQCHPDVNKSVEAEQRFGYVAKAYAVLRDPAKRAQYDHRLSAAAVRATAA